MKKRDEIGSAYELLCTDMPDEERLDGMAHTHGVAYRTKTVKSGKMLEVMCYPILRGKEAAAARRRKKENVSSVRRQQINENNRVMRFTRLAETNFKDDDYFFTGTFEGDDLPDEKDVKKAVDRFRRRLNRKRVKFGLDGNMKILGVYEGKEDGDNKKRLHFHALIDGGLPRDMIENEWRHGFANTRRIQKSDNGSITGIAKYMSKQVRRHYEHAYYATRNLKKPTETVADRKVSSHRAWVIAAQPDEARRVLEARLYPGYQIEGVIQARTSAFLDGAYIYVRMRLKS